MQKSNEEWWECTNRMCGQKIQFVTLGSRTQQGQPHMLLRQQYEATIS